MPNVHQPDFDEPREHDGFRARRARLGYQLGTERLVLSLWELPPGEAAYPFHFHLAEEELVVVLAGTPSLRTPAGWRELAEGEVVSFPRGERGAHQLVNRTDAPVRFLAASTHGDPDVIVYPDSDKIGASERLPRDAGCGSSSGARTRSTTTTARRRPPEPESTDLRGRCARLGRQAAPPPNAPRSRISVDPG